MDDLQGNGTDLPEAFRRCSRCRKPCTLADGSMVQARIRSSFGTLFMLAGRLAGARPELEFMCHTCQAFRRRTMIALYGVFMLLLAIAMRIIWTTVGGL